MSSPIRMCIQPTATEHDSRHRHNNILIAVPLHNATQPDQDVLQA
jgi:hypothetical protein